jgi:hypothetical protein
LLLLRAGRAAEFTLWVARPELLRELLAAWMTALQRVVSALAVARPETRLERLRLLLERLEVSAAPELQPWEGQASRRARQLRQEQRWRA